MSFPQSVGTAPAFYNYYKDGRPVDAGYVAPNGTLVFGHQVRYSQGCFSRAVLTPYPVRPQHAAADLELRPRAELHNFQLVSPLLPCSSCLHVLIASLCSTNLELSSYAISTTDDFTVTVTVENTGPVDGKEVVQVYLTDEISSVVTPNQLLAGFTKVLIP